MSIRLVEHNRTLGMERPKWVEDLLKGLKEKDIVVEVLYFSKKDCRVLVRFPEDERNFAISIENLDSGFLVTPPVRINLSSAATAEELVNVILRCLAKIAQVKADRLKSEYELWNGRARLI